MLVSTRILGEDPRTEEVVHGSSRIITTYLITAIYKVPLDDTWKGLPVFISSLPPPQKFSCIVPASSFMLGMSPEMSFE
jgi:hypothetical protein